MYSKVGYLKKHDIEFSTVTSTTSDETAPYTERILDELVRKGKVIVDSATKEYVELAIGRERQYQSFRELVESIAASPSIPYTPQKVLKESIISLVKNGEVGVYRGELVQPEEIDAKMARKVLSNLYFAKEISRIGERDYVLKADFAERLKEAAEKKLGDKIASEILRIMDDRDYMKIEEIIRMLPEYGDRDIVYAITSSPELVPYCGDSELLEIYPPADNANEGFNVSEAEVTAECFAVKKEFAEKFVEKEKVIGIGEGEKRDYYITKKPDEVTDGEKLKIMTFNGENADDLKRDITNLVGGIEFKRLEGTLTAKVKSEAVSFTATVPTEKGSKLNDVLTGIADLSSDKLEYSLKMELNEDVEVDEDMKMFLEQLGETESEKKVMVR